jgi:hypothetical protein
MQHSSSAVIDRASYLGVIGSQVWLVKAFLEAEHMCWPINCVNRKTMIYIICIHFGNFPSNK